MKKIFYQTDEFNTPALVTDLPHGGTYLVWFKVKRALLGYESGEKIEVQALNDIIWNLKGYLTRNRFINRKQTEIEEERNEIITGKLLPHRELGCNLSGNFSIIHDIIKHSNITNRRFDLMQPSNLPVIASDINIQ